MRTLATLVLLALAGCDSAGLDGAGLAVYLTAANYTSGSESPVTIANETDRPVYIHQCGGRAVLFLERRGADDSWRIIGGPNAICSDAEDQFPFRLDEGEAQTVSFFAPYPGEYRLRTTYGFTADFYAFSETATSETFEVRNR